MLRNAGELGHTELVRLFNASYTSATLPDDKKQANIAPIPKPKEPGAYRPIFLLCCNGKTMEKMVLKRLQWVCGDFPSNVFAYCKGTGAAECLATFFDTVTSWKLTAIFLDLEKAFELANETDILSLHAEKGVKGLLLR